MERPDPKLSEEEIKRLVEEGNIHLSDVYDPWLTDGEKIAIAEGNLQSPEND
jgi:hypothetical protein